MKMNDLGLLGPEANKVSGRRGYQILFLLATFIVTKAFARLCFRCFIRIF